MKRQYRAPTEDDKKREKCRAILVDTVNPAYVAWNADYQCWAIYGRPHILVAVRRILEPINGREA